MALFRPSFLSVCCLLLSVSVSAQQSTSTAVTTSDPQAVVLVQNSLAALTSSVAVSDVTLTGTARRIAGSDDETGTATLEATAAGDSRVYLSLSGGTWTEIRNHSALPLPGSLPPEAPASDAQTPQPVGEWIGPGGVPNAMASQNIMTNAAWFFPALTLETLAASQNYVLSYVGQETYDGESVLHVSAWLQFPQLETSSSTNGGPSVPPAIALMQHLSQMDFYLDPNSLFPVALVFTAHPDNNASIDIPIEIRFSGYQAVSGITVPMQVQKYINNGLALDLQFTSATLNSGLPSSAFALQ